MSDIQNDNHKEKDACDAFLASGREYVLGMFEKTAAATPPRQPRILFRTPAELRDYEQDGANLLVGNCHIMRGDIVVIGGEPGVGKSRSATALAVAGATGGSWLGLETHRRFKTMIVQTENGLHRLQQEFAGLDCAGLADWVRVSEPPPFGLTLENPEFQADMKEALREFQPDVVVFDPWNAVAKDDKQKDYAETFNALRGMLVSGGQRPALVIVAHTRKPAQGEKRNGGTGLMHILAGSHMLASVPRSVFIMVRASEDETSDRIVWFNPKNNNGQLVARTAWHRTGAGFVPAGEFDWEEFDNPAGDRVMITLEDIHLVFDGSNCMELTDAADALARLLGITKRAAYNALGEKGKFAAHLARKGQQIILKET